VVPVIKYSNADIQKLQIIKENNGKSGVYHWVGLVNGKSYIGSSVNFAKRFGGYYNINFISNKRYKKKCQIIKILHYYQTFKHH